MKKNKYMFEQNCTKALYAMLQEGRMTLCEVLLKIDRLNDFLNLIDDTIELDSDFHNILNRLEEDSKPQKERF